MGKILELINISKYFGAVTALSGISIQFNKGEIHTLLGENGAGKSTIIKTICGEINPDEGQIIINGKEVKQNTPLLARENGIAVVHQELVVFDNMTVYENIFPYPVAFTKCHAIDKKEHIRRAEELINKFDIKISPVSKMGDLKLSSQQMVEILRALCQNAKIILLDEPTSGLNTQETRLLMDTIKSLRDDGITIIYISHRINEVLEISDTITIMRDGKKIDTIKNIPGLTENELVAKMVGRDFSGSIYSKKNYSDISDREVIFRAEGFSKKGVLNDCSISLRKGEIVGVFGLEGSGTNNFSRMMYGLETADKGVCYIKDKRILPLNPEKCIENRIVYLNNNRKNAGLFMNMNIADNMIAPSLKEMSNNGIVDKKKILTYCQSFIDKFKIILGSIFNNPTSLSGGNQQKLMLSICLGIDPEVLIINEPTRGIDVAAKAQILNFILNIVNEGMSVICFSSDLPELITLCDRVVVMNNMQIAGEVVGEAISEEHIMKYAASKIIKEDKNEKQSKSKF